MAENIIVGSGLSGFYLSIITSDKFKLISIKNKKKILNQFRRKKIEVNKLFSEKATSYGLINFKQLNIHEHTLHGGNSKIWGGFIDSSNISCQFKENIKLKNIELVKLSYDKTYCISNNNYINKLEFNKYTLDVGKLITNYTDGELISIDYQNKSIEYYNYILKSIEILKYKKLYLATGAAKLIEILYQSKLIRINDQLSLDEFRMFYKISFRKQIIDSKNIVIKYNIRGVLRHLFSIKYIPKIIDLIPLYVEQIFTSIKVSVVFHLNNDGVIVMQDKKRWGQSIHYCNLKINGQKIENFIGKFDKDIQVISQPAVEQKLGGPISQDIISKVEKSINHNA